MKKNSLTCHIYLLLVGISLLTVSCKKAIEINSPPDELTPDKVFDSDASATAATLSNYTSLGTFDANFVGYLGLYTDELSQTTLNATTTEFANGSLTVTNGAVSNIWQNLYITIYKANANIIGLNSAKGLTDATRKQLLGESLFIRAYCHFNLVNLFGDVPLITTTSVTSTDNAPRSPVSLVYTQIIADLVQAKTLLTSNYPSGEKVRPNLWAASALLARVYLYQQKWAQAESESSGIIGSGAYSLPSLGTVFYKNSDEAIWQLWNANGYTSISAIVPVTSGTPSYILSNSLNNAWEVDDQRKANWTKTVTVGGKSYNVPYKYKLRSASSGPNAEYTMYFRLSEQYLIRAESRANQNINLSGAIADLNIIRSRAGLPELQSGLTQAQVLLAVAKERQIELFTEGGHRFFDLKRTGALNNILSIIKGNWDSNKSPLFPIPQAQRNINSSLTQNIGY
jgi:hypothetical protein